MYSKCYFPADLTVTKVIQDAQVCPDICRDLIVDRPLTEMSNVQVTIVNGFKADHKRRLKISCLLYWFCLINSA